MGQDTSSKVGLFTRWFAAAAMGLVAAVFALGLSAGAQSGLAACLICGLVFSAGFIWYERVIQRRG